MSAHVDRIYLHAPSVEAETPSLLPLHCPSVDDVEVHPLEYSPSTATPAPGAVVGCRLVLPKAHPKAAALKRALTVEARFVPSLRRRPRPTLFYELKSSYVLASKMAFVAANIRVEVDARKTGDPLPDGTAYTNPRGLFPFQRMMRDLIMERLRCVGGGLAVAPCGVGKSEVIGSVIGECGLMALVMVPKRQVARQLVLLYQCRFPHLEVRQWDGSHKKVSKHTHIIVAVTNSVARLPKEVCASRGLIVLDEAHHAPAKTVQQALACFAARYVVGLTATPYRSDGCEAVFPFMFGPMIVTVHRPWMPVIIRGLQFQETFDVQPESYSQAVNLLCENAAWTTMVLNAVLEMARRAKENGGRVLVMVDRVRFAMEICAHVGGVISDKQWKRLRTYETDRKTKKWKPTCAPTFAESSEEVQKRFAPFKSTLYVGVTMRDGEREAAGKVGDIVWSTNSMANEGLNLDNIHKEALFCKAKRPQQHVGRCLRITTMADVPEIVFSTENYVERLQGNASSQTKYFEHYEGWPVEWIPHEQVTKRLAKDGTVPKEPTKTWVGHARKANMKRQRNGQKKKRS